MHEPPLSSISTFHQRLHWREPDAASGVPLTAHKTSITAGGLTAHTAASAQPVCKCHCTLLRPKQHAAYSSEATVASPNLNLTAQHNNCPQPTSPLIIPTDRFKCQCSGSFAANAHRMHHIADAMMETKRKRQQHNVVNLSRSTLQRTAAGARGP
jgi:hypothetical protein